MNTADCGKYPIPVTPSEAMAIRLNNTEKAICMLWTLIHDEFSEECVNKADQMINDFFEANQMLGADFHLGSAPFGKSHLQEADFTRN
ncbi:MAG: hypothetical protein PF795_03285 [Kiritimatiellae bacterium]|jgi:hypothetical protein|nr:hypothetical protein [Kiritimatiellia bacterium]